MNRLLLGFLTLVTATGCLADDDLTDHDCDDSYRTHEMPAAIEGRWSLPPDVVAAGQSQYVAYESAGPWNGGAACGGSFLPGARQLADQLVAWFEATHYGGYNCRRNTGNTSQLSVHGTGRAIDLFIPLDGGQADNDKGDPVANWLVENAEYIGVQFIVWDRTSWGAHRSGTKERPYTGPHPHHDHLHIELTSAGARMETGYFRDGAAPGCESSCEGNILHGRNCQSGDCSAFGATCVDDNLGARCVSPVCPSQGRVETCVSDNHIGTCDNGAVVSTGDCSAYGSRCVNDELGARCVFAVCQPQGQHTACVDQDRIATCNDGEVSIGDCSAFAAHCADDGGTGEARCVSYFCAAPGEATFAHTSCFLDGELYSCGEGGNIESKTACPEGTYCTVYPEPHCEPGSVCPPWDGQIPGSAQEVAAKTTTLCLNDTVIASCLSGAVNAVNDCAEVDSICSTAGGVEPRCVSVHCVSGPDEVPVAHDICLDEGTIGHCRDDGKLEFEECLDSGRCLDDAGTVRCEAVPGGGGMGSPGNNGHGPTGSTEDDEGDDNAAMEANTPTTNTADSCSTVGPVGPSRILPPAFLLLLLAAVVVRRK